MLRVFLSKGFVSNGVFQKASVRFSTKAVVETSIPKSVSEMNEDTANEVKPEKSKRQILRDVKIDMKLLNHLDSIRLGFLAKRRHRVKVARKIDNSQIEMRSMKVGDSYSKETPFPFKAKGLLIHHAHSWESIPHYFEGNPGEVAIIGRSNVGKSTLVNSLIGFDPSYVQKALMSDKPGQTTQLSFYQIGSVAPKYDPWTDPLILDKMDFSKLSEAKRQLFITATNAIANAKSTTSASVLLANHTKNTKNLSIFNKNALNPLQNATISTNKDMMLTAAEIRAANGRILQEKPKQPALILVDMPGYGFAFMNEENKERCETLTKRYLFSNILGGETGEIKQNIANIDEIKAKHKPLKRVLLLLDARHGLKFSDIVFFNGLYADLCSEYSELKDEIRAEITMEYEHKNKNSKRNYINSNNTPLDHSVEKMEQDINDAFNKQLSKLLAWKLQIVLTKCDLIERTELCRRIQMLTKNIHSQLPPIFVNELPVVILSGKEKKGLLDLQTELSVLAPPPPNNKHKEEIEKLRRKRAYEEYQLKFGSEEVKKRISADRRKLLDEKAKVEEETGFKATDKLVYNANKGTFSTKLKPFTPEALKENIAATRALQEAQREIHAKLEQSNPHFNAQKALQSGADLGEKKIDIDDFGSISIKSGKNIPKEIPKKGDKRDHVYNVNNTIKTENRRVTGGFIELSPENLREKDDFSSGTLFKNRIPAIESRVCDPEKSPLLQKLVDKPGLNAKQRRDLARHIAANDVYGEREKVVKTPSPESRTGHLTAEEYKFKLLHEKPLFPRKISDSEIEELYGLKKTEKNDKYNKNLETKKGLFENKEEKMEITEAEWKPTSVTTTTTPSAPSTTTTATVNTPATTTTNASKADTVVTYTDVYSAVAALPMERKSSANNSNITKNSSDNNVNNSSNNSSINNSSTSDISNNIADVSATTTVRKGGRRRSAPIPVRIDGKITFAEPVLPDRDDDSVVDNRKVSKFATANKNKDKNSDNKSANKEDDYDEEAPDKYVTQFEKVAQEVWAKNKQQLVTDKKLRRKERERAAKSDNNSNNNENNSENSSNSHNSSKEKSTSAEEKSSSAKEKSTSTTRTNPATTPAVPKLLTPEGKIDYNAIFYSPPPVTVPRTEKAKKNVLDNVSLKNKSMDFEQLRQQNAKQDQITLNNKNKALHPNDHRLRGENKGRFIDFSISENSTKNKNNSALTKKERNNQLVDTTFGKKTKEPKSYDEMEHGAAYSNTKRYKHPRDKRPLDFNSDWDYEDSADWGFDEDDDTAPGDNAFSNNEFDRIMKAEQPVVHKADAAAIKKAERLAEENKKLEKKQQSIRKQERGLGHKADYFLEKEIFKHASTENFITSAYDEVPLARPNAPTRLNNKQRRLIRQKKEADIAAGILFPKESNKKNKK